MQCQKLSALTLLFALLVSLALSVSLASAQAGSTFPLDVSRDEVSLSRLVRPIPPPVVRSLTFGDQSDTLVVLMIQRSELRQRRSTDGGSTFNAERVIVGPSLGGLEVIWTEGALAADGTLYVALAVADPQGDVGLQVVHSSDLGNTWSTPLDLVRRPGSDDGVFALGIGAASGGRVSVAWVDRWDGHVYARSSTNGGTSFTPATRVDVIGGEAAFAAPPRVRIGADGTIHTAFTVEAPGGDEVRYSRSTDGGVSFTLELGFESCLGPDFEGVDPVLEITASGSLLVAFVKEDATEIHRSTDNGTSFGCVANIAPSAGNAAQVVVLAPSPSDGTLLAGLVEASSSIDPNNLVLRVVRSSDDGASFGTPLVLATTLANQIRSAGPIFSIDEGFIALDRFVPQFVRTADGTWVAAWNDTRDDTSATNKPVLLWDNYLSSSTDDGVTWSSAQRAASGNTSTDLSALSSLITIAPDDVVTTWLDDRAQGLGTAEIYLARSPAAALSFTSESRVDTPKSGLDGLTCLGTDTTLASAGPDHVYAAFSCSTADDVSRVFVGVSDDKGESWSAQRVGRPPAASSNGFDFTPYIAATSDGAVYAAYISYRSDGGTELRVNRSNDWGANWLSEDVVVESDAVADGRQISLSDLAAGPGGVVLVAFTDPEGTNSFISRSDDGAASFATTELDPAGAGDSVLLGRLCLSGSRAVVAYAYNDALAGLQLRAKISSDSGASFGSATTLSGTELFDGLSHRTACNANGSVVVSWGGLSFTTFAREAFARRYTNISGWESNQTIGSFFDQGLRVTDALFVDSGTALVAMRADTLAGVPGQVFGDQRAYLARSTDEGASFGPLVRLDTAAPVPGSVIYGPRLASEAGGHAWISWEDVSAGAGTMVVRRSDDAGATFGALARLHRSAAQGSRAHVLGSASDIVPLKSAALADRAFFGWAGDRQSIIPEPLVGCEGCPAGSGAVGPGTAAGLSLSRVSPGTLRLTWSPDCGTGSQYGIYRGNLALGYSSAAPESGACAVTATSFDLAEGAPPAEFFLVVPNDGSGDGSYGALSDGSPRGAPSTVCFAQGVVDACAP